MCAPRSMLLDRIPLTAKVIFLSCARQPRQQHCRCVSLGPCLHYSLFYFLIFLSPYVFLLPFGLAIRFHFLRTFGSRRVGQKHNPLVLCVCICSGLHRVVRVIEDLAFCNCKGDFAFRVFIYKDYCLSSYFSRSAYFYYIFHCGAAGFDLQIYNISRV